MAPSGICHVVAIALLVLYGMRADELLAAGINQEISQQARLFGPAAHPLFMGVRVELGLHGVPGGGVDDGLVLTVEGFTLVGDLPDVDGVRQNLVDVTPAERPVAPHFAAGGGKRARSGALS